MAVTPLVHNGHRQVKSVGISAEFFCFASVSCHQHIVIKRSFSLKVFTDNRCCHELVSWYPKKTLGLGCVKVGRQDPVSTGCLNQISHEARGD